VNATAATVGVVWLLIGPRAAGRTASSARERNRKRGIMKRNMRRIVALAIVPAAAAISLSACSSSGNAACTSGQAFGKQRV
jgi:hypothetical protein